MGFVQPAREKRDDRRSSSRPETVMVQKIGLALGSGAARGLAHIGVIQRLEQEGIRPAIVCGSSIGSLIGAAYAMGRLGRLTEWLRSLDFSKMWKLMDFTLSGGVLAGKKLISFFEEHVQDLTIEELPLTYGAVACDLTSGREVWLKSGPVLEAVRASIALPGLLTPLIQEERVLVDGGLVNPVPVSMCRALGADIVIGVNLNGDLMSNVRPRAELEGNFADEKLGLLEVVGRSINVMQDRITRSRLAGDPPEIMFQPLLGSFGLLDFHRADEGIEEGVRCVQRMQGAVDQLKKLVEENRGF